MHTSTDGWFLSAGDRDEWPTGTLSTDTILDTITDVFYVVDRRGRFREWNERFREATGYTDAEIADLHQFDIIPDTAEAEARELLSAVADGAEVTLEAPLVTADGERVPHEFTASPLTDDDGEVWGMAGTARDISDHRAREDLLRDLHDSTRELLAAETEREVAEATARIAYDRFDCATVGVRLLEDDQLVMVAARSDDERLDGRLPPVAVGEGFVGEAYEGGEAVVYDTLDEVDPGVHYPARSKLLVPIPGYGMLNMAATEPGAFDEVDLELGRVFAADVEAALERADRERRLRERKRELERYETLVETMSDGVYATDEGHHVTMVNEAAADVLGYDREELLGRYVNDFGETPPEEKESERQRLREGDQDVGTISEAYERPDGETIHVENHFSLLPGEGFQGTVGVVRDVTDQREREQLLRDLHQTSRRLLTAETRDEVAERATRAADLLGFGSVAVRLLDDAGKLTVVARETGDERFEQVEMPDYEPGEGFVGEAYERGESVAYGDVSDDVAYDTGPLRSCMFFPIPGHGMVSMASAEVDAFDETDLGLGRVLAADVEAALERADRERRLRERKRELEQYETVVETMGDGVYATDADRRVTMVNDTMAEMLGRDREELIDIDAAIATDNEAVLKEAARLRNQLRTGEQSVVTQEAPITTADGESIAVENRMSALPGEEFRGTVGVVRDVTDQREREQLLRDLHETSRTLLTAETREEVAERATRAADHLGFGSVAVRLLDEDGRLTLVARESNDERFEHIEMPAVEPGEGLIGEIYDAGEPVVYGDAEVDYDVDLMESAMFLPIPGHGMISVASSESDAFDETDLGLGRVLAADVEAALERADRERRLRERKRELEQYETLVETISDGVYMTDADRTITMVNDALTEMLGRDREELLGEPTSVTAPADTIEEAGALKQRLLDGDLPVATLHGELERADGTPIPIENRFSLLPGEGDQGTVGVIRDVTERRRREEQLKQSRDELARLNRINELIQETIHALASTATREEIEATVCRLLADSEFYRFAMTGELVHNGGQVVPTEWAGEGADYTETFSVTTADGETGFGPAGRAIRTGEAKVCQDIRTDPQFEPWRAAAIEHGFESAVAIPLRHGETVHGILCVYAAERNAFSGRELSAFEVLGDMVGFAISATQNRRLVQADDLLEFEFRVTEAGTVTAGLTESLDCRYRLLGVASTSDPGLLHYTAVEGASAEAVREALADTADSDRVRNVRVVSAEDDACLLEARIVDSIPAVLQESGVQTVEATAADGVIEFVARGPRDLDFRALLDTLDTTHGEAELLAKREVEAEVRAGERPPDRVTERLTDRQAAALNAAYFSGYFDWPRDSTAEEVAEALGITSATLHQHLRHAQRKLLETCFVDSAERPA